jgi:hypothetical protein
MLKWAVAACTASPLETVGLSASNMSWCACPLLLHQSAAESIADMAGNGCSHISLLSYASDMFPFKLIPCCVSTLASPRAATCSKARLLQ